MTDRVPVPDPLDADAYRADCARRGVEPGPLPGLSWGSDNIEWTADDDGVTIEVASLQAERRLGAVRWSVRGPGESADLTELARLVAVADAARRSP